MKPHLVCTPAGLPITWTLAAPKADEPQILAALIEGGHTWPHPGLLIPGDRGYIAAGFEQWLRHPAPTPHARSTTPQTPSPGPGPAAGSGCTLNPVSGQVPALIQESSPASPLAHHVASMRPNSARPRPVQRPGWMIRRRPATSMSLRSRVTSGLLVTLRRNTLSKVDPCLSTLPGKVSDGLHTVRWHVLDEPVPILHPSQVQIQQTQ